MPAFGLGLGVSFAQPGGGVAAFTPAAVGTLGRAWDVSGLSALSNNDPVGSWPGAWGTSVAATGSGATRPTYKTAQTPAGRAAVLFDNVAATILNFTSTVALSEWHLFMTMKFTSVGAFNQAYLGGAGGATFGTILSDASTSEVLFNDAVGSANLTYGGSPKDTTTWHINEWKLTSGGVLSHRRDGTATGTTPTLAGPYTFGTLGNWTAGTGPLRAYVSSVAFYYTALSDADALLTRNFLKALDGTP